MKYILILLCLSSLILEAQDKCIPYANLMEAAVKKESKEIADALAPSGYSLTAEQNGNTILSGTEMSMVTIKYAGDTLIAIEYNFEGSKCAEPFSQEIMTAGYTKDFNWSGGQST